MVYIQFKLDCDLLQRFTVNSLSKEFDIDFVEITNTNQYYCNLPIIKKTHPIIDVKI